MIGQVVPTDALLVCQLIGAAMLFDSTFQVASVRLVLYRTE